MSSPPPDALLQHLIGVLRPRKVQVLDDSWEGSTRLFECLDAAGGKWTVWLAPNEGEGNAFEVGESFLLGYRGDPPPAALSALRGLASRLRALARSTNGENWFTAPSSIGEPSGPSLIYGDSRLEMRVTLQCNERCLFCNSQEGAENLVVSREEAFALLEEARSKGAEVLVLTGGEPLVVEWLPDVARQARKQGYSRINLQTNGVLLARADYWERMQETGPDELFISVHGPNDEVVKSISGVAGLLASKQEAIVASIEAGYRVVVAFVLCRQNMTHATATVEMLASLPARPEMISFSFVAPSGAAITAGRETIPTMTEAAPHLLAGLRRGAELGVKSVLMEFCGIPTCVEPALRAFSEPYYSDHPLGVPPDKQKLDVCPDCHWNHRCTGVFKGYLDLYGPDEILNAPHSHREAP